MKNNIKESIILITGGAGFVASYIVEELLKYEPRKILIIDNLLRGNLSNLAKFQGLNLEFVEGDIRNKTLLENLVKQTDYVFHLAALRINACASNPQEAFEVMIEATFNLVELCRKYQVKKIIYASSASVYGLADVFPTPETAHPYDNQTFYGGAKLWGEQLLRNYFFMYNLPYVALRYFNVYGIGMDTEGKYTEVMIKWLACIKNETEPLIFGDGSATMDFVYVSDVAKASVAALLTDVNNEVFNIGSQRETSLKELLSYLLAINKSTLVPKFMPENSINPVSRRLADISKARQMLHFEPSISLEKGLELLSEWYIANNQ
ncbi:MAG: NAD-dependent epimerase/dehydratase family protein [Thermonemataceae bacterium]|nr:NAD-dependent epimerase/dehydratase family protein [Thermonemataceae bacterium]